MALKKELMMERDLKNDMWISLDYPLRGKFHQIPGWKNLSGHVSLGRFNQGLRTLLSAPLVQKIFSTITIGYVLYYLIWRATATLAVNSLVFSWILLLAEGFGLLNYIIFSWTTSNIHPVVPFQNPAPGKTVDVFLPTYNESLDILEATLTGCNRIRYSHKTYVLDDGNREEVRLLAERMGCEYISRTSNQHAKAGNINHALALTSGEFIVVLDADMVPQPNFIHRTLGYFENKKLAFVQTPQEFFNSNSIQHSGSNEPWHEQKLFYRVIQPGKNHSNAAFWCGSPSILRRTALEDIGGVAIESITEDIHTSVRLHSRGWESLFLNEVLAYGIAPETFDAFLKQRLRWAQGTMQLYRSKESPIWIPGLTLKQRISYLGSFLAYFESYQKLIYLLTPVLIVILGIYPMSVSIDAFLIRWIPYFLLTLTANEIGGRGYFRYFLTEKFNMMKMIIFIQASLILFWKQDLIFKVTPKSFTRSVYRDELRAVRSFLVLATLLFGVVLFGLYKILLRGSGPGIDFSYPVALVWSLYNFLLIAVSLIAVTKKRHDRVEYRFPVGRTCQLIDRSAGWRITEIKLNNISPRGAGLIVRGDIDLSGTGKSICFSAPGENYLFLPVGTIHYQKKLPSGERYIGVSYGNLAPQLKLRLLEYIFICLPNKICADN